MSQRENSHIRNGRFQSQLTSWTATGATYVASDGDEHYGMAQLAVGDTLTQLFSVGLARTYTLHIAVKCAAVLADGDATVTIRDNSSNLITTRSLTVSAINTWTVNEINLGLPGISNMSLTFINVAADADIKIDDVWLWHIPMTRTDIAARTHINLAGSATEYGWTTTPAGALTEGDYTYAIDAVLAGLGSTNPETGEVDIRWLHDPQNAVKLLETEMLRRAHNSAILETDIRLGPRQESRSQIARNLAERIGVTFNNPGTRVATMRELRYKPSRDFPRND